MEPGFKPAVKGLDIWQLEPSQEGNFCLVRLCFNSMAATHKRNKPAALALRADSRQ